jgi:hypothetical protein
MRAICNIWTPSVPVIFIVCFGLISFPVLHSSDECQELITRANDQFYKGNCSYQYQSVLCRLLFHLSWKSLPPPVQLENMAISRHSVGATLNPTNEL